MVDETDGKTGVTDGISLVSFPSLAERVGNGNLTVSVGEAMMQGQKLGSIIATCDVADVDDGFLEGDLDEVVDV